MTDTRTDRWQLPDGVDELLPGAAWQIEQLRRDIVDCCRRWGFELVMPPLIEYIDSLLTGSGETMNLQTFKLVDQNNGRTLGVRADMTPQVARMDAHALRSESPNRLCFTGTVLRTRADRAGGSRAPQQFGAELYGHAGFESDVEIIRLMLESVHVGGIPPTRLLLDLGHVGVYRALAEDAKLAADDEQQVFEALQRGSGPDVRERLAAAGASSEATERLIALCSLRGDVGRDGDNSILDRARELLAGASAGVGEALDTLASVIAAVRATHPDVRMLVDLSELRGFRYHTGTLFAVYDDAGSELARGGRYDSIGEAFGHARPATGFSGELKMLLDRASALNGRRADAMRNPELAIHVADAGADGVWPEVCRLRESGQQVLCALPGDSNERARCDRELVQEAGRWIVRPID